MPAREDSAETAGESAAQSGAVADSARVAAPAASGGREVQTAADGLFGSDYYFPPLMRAAYDPAFESVPDTQMIRNYYTSVEQAFNRRCSEWVSPALTAYWSPEARAIWRDPAESGRVFASILSGGASGAHELPEGEADGARFIDAHGCESEASTRLRSNLHQMMIQRMNLRPAPENMDRVIALLSPVRREEMGIAAVSEVVPTQAELISEACTREYVAAAENAALPWINIETRRIELAEFCRCLTSAILRSDLPDARLRAMETGFVAAYDEVVTAADPVFMRNRSECIQ